MSIFLVRHASAGDRQRWHLADHERPLDERGRQQALRITAFFADAEVRAVWSSPATRCLETIRGVAECHSLELDMRHELGEGTATRQIWELLLEQAALGDLVVCSHGDVIGWTVDRLLRTGLQVSGARGCAKASIWELKVDGTKFSEGIYTAQP
ncbi:MAG: histidine phosphatase family protein [Acidimicrobiia bacterium]|nr:histidine phosphatase family protein [Acidimicrobiia bacterium]